MVSHILDDLEGLIRKILEKTGWDNKNVKEKIQKKQDEYGGLLTEAGAAYSIAKEVGALEEAKDLPGERIMKINGLKQALSSVDLAVEVVQMFAPRFFEQDGKTKSVINMIVKDETGDVRLVMWEREDLANKIFEGSKIKIKNAYVKKRDEDLEVHLSYKGDIEVIFTPKRETVSLSEINAAMADFNFDAKVVRIYPIKEFEREGRKGKVASLEVTDEKDTKRLVLWDPHADLVNRLRIGDIIKVQSAYVKDNAGVLEIHLGKRGRLLYTTPELKKEEAKEEFKESIEHLR